jgi:RNA polymerase sigma factor (sigma-70 family)
LRVRALTLPAGARPRGCSGSRCTSSRASSGARRPSGAHAGGWAWSGSSSRTPTSSAIEALGSDPRVHVLLERLSPQQRDAIRAHVIDERPYGEIARVQGTSEAVVRKRVSRGLAAVRKRMGPGA